MNVQDLKTCRYAMSQNASQEKERKKKTLKDFNQRFTEMEKPPLAKLGESRNHKQATS